METTNIYRREDKYWLNPAQAVLLSRKLKLLLHGDRNSLQPDYLVRSIYFDSLDDQDYHDKLDGVDTRQKVRLRSYNPTSDRVRLEVKRKIGEHQHKASLWLTRSQAQDFLANRYTSLRDVILKNNDLQSLYPLLITKCYRPKVWCEYHRMAFTHPLGDLRITIDHDIRTSETNFDLFAETTPQAATLIEGAVLEVKANATPPAFVVAILSPLGLERLALSKYCHSRLNYYEFLD